MPAVSRGFVAESGGPGGCACACAFEGMDSTMPKAAAAPKMLRATSTMDCRTLRWVMSESVGGEDGGCSGSNDDMFLSFWTSHVLGGQVQDGLELKGR